jgi:sRNA-binding carbon storage regulator CsrA
MSHLILQQEADTEDAVVEIWLPDGRTVEVELIDVRNGNRARIGYMAPRDVLVHRRSVANRIRAAAAPVPLTGSHVRVPGYAPVAGSVDAGAELGR